MKNRKATVKELAEYLNSSEGLIRKLIRENKIPFMRIESKIIFEYEEIDKWLSNNRVVALNDKGELVVNLDDGKEINICCGLD